MRLLVLLAFVSTVSFADNSYLKETPLKNKGCARCHALEKEKKAPSFKFISQKYALDKEGIVKWLTTAPMVKPKGAEDDENHNDLSDISYEKLMLIVDWILQQ